MISQLRKSIKLKPKPNNHFTVTYKLQLHDSGEINTTTKGYQNHLPEMVLHNCKSKYPNFLLSEVKRCKTWLWKQKL